ncbi:MAG: HAD-IA family hydrolase [Deltaproteobacteria bacterium]|nr:HAD-IA family hydrolase [Deltaproteobacteria bacterium]
MRSCVLFDLDDTLYPEADFVRSGFDAVSRELARRFGIASAKAREALDQSLARHGRGRTFDLALEQLGLDNTPGLVSELVRVYRGHCPAIALYPDASRALDRLSARGVRLGLVTDGDPQVQRSKARTLGLERWLTALVFTWDAGPEHQKPHPSGYERALVALGVAAEGAVYVGDNPAKDFRGARGLGLRTVRVRRGAHAGLEAAGPEDGADTEVEDLDALKVAAQLA